MVRNMFFSFSTVLLVTSLLLESACGGRFLDHALDRIARHEDAAQAEQVRKLQSRGKNKGRFLSNATLPYKIHSLPDVDFDIGEMYSGSIPVGTNESESLFFVFAPTIGKPVDEVTIWLNGGPGCSSLEGFALPSEIFLRSTGVLPRSSYELLDPHHSNMSPSMSSLIDLFMVLMSFMKQGFFQENGRFTWRPGTYAPVENPYSWVNLTNMLWVDQPIGTGFTTGTPKATTQEETAQDFVNFFKNFEDVFGIKNYKIYVTGESYAGRYVPYISAAMLDQEDKEYFDLSGALVYDPCIGQFDYVQEEVPAVPFVVANNNLFNFNETFLAQLEALHESCGYAAWIEQYMVFPPSGVQPPVFFNFTTEENCDVFDLINEAALATNPCFNIYELPAMCPLVWDVLAFPTELVYQPEGATVYFNRTDVKKAMHAPKDIEWAECSGPVFLGEPFLDGYYQGGPESEGDLSADPIQKVLPQVIEATNRVLVSNGDYDMIILTNGTLMSIQNMTWNGALGFASMPSTPINVTLPDLEYMAVFDENGLDGYDSVQGIMGVQHYVRWLMWAETYQSGHMQPQFQPRVTYRHLQWVLGRINTL